MKSLQHERPLKSNHAVPLALSVSLLIIATYAICGKCEEVISPGKSVVPLFNGKNLDGFYTWLVETGREDPRSVFSVTNGSLRISGNGLGYLSTVSSYRNYLLRLEYRWGRTNDAWGGRIGKARDSGVFLHSFGPDGNSHDGQGAFKAAIECNIFQGATGDFLLIRGSARDGSLLSPRITVHAAPDRDEEGWPTWMPEGQALVLERWGRVNWRHKSRRWRDVTDFRGPRDPTRPVGEWNLLECLCLGDRIVIRLNGKKVNEARAVFPRQGPILLQCEGSEIFFRNIELHPARGKVPADSPPGTRPGG